MTMNTFYTGAFAVYLLGVLALGAWGNKQSESLEDFWLYGRDLGPTLATWSLVANFVSTVAIIGLVGAIYTDGYSVMLNIQFGLMLGLSGMYFVAHKVRSFEYTTLPDIIVDVTGYEGAKPISAVVLLLNGWLYVLMQLVGASLLVTTITGIDYKYIVWVVAVVFIAYTVMGGLVSVAWTDLVQGTVMVASVFFVSVYLVTDLGGLASVNTQLANIDPELLTPLRPDQTIIGVLGTATAFFGTLFTSQSAIIHLNATRDLKTAKSHIAVSGVILTAFSFAMVFLGGAAVVALNNAGIPVDNPDAAFPLLLTQYLPQEIGALLILAAMGAILSTTDTMLHGTGVTAAHDIFSYFRPDADDETKLRVFRFSAVTAGLAAAGVAIDPPGTIIVIYYLRAVLLTCAFLVPVYAALRWDWLSGRPVLAGIVVGVVTGVGWTIAGPSSLPGTFVGIGSSAVTMLVTTLAGKWTPDSLAS
ncbi:sodium:solute symporter family protein [Halorussus lipolyticus]|uniref:sodium:solute symporter family protein n=1 Tax=Halorussus lipolyticus TaxID=3034024 RepID=UPI0023E823CE|nr:sodium:solute symporter family protein [Halorussus sp. DT80]